MILHTQPQDGDLFPDEAIFTAKAVRPVPLPPSPAPSSSETLTAALRTALAEILPAPLPPRQTPRPRAAALPSATFAALATPPPRAVVFVHPLV